VTGASEPRAGDRPEFGSGLARAAADAAGGWVYTIDPALGPDGDVPPHAIAGAWRVGADGRPTGEFVPNPGYRPSPAPAPGGKGAPPLLATLLALTLGGAAPEDVSARLLDGHVLVALAEPPPGARAQIVAEPDADGRWALLAFSDPRTLAAWAEPPLTASVRGRDLVDLAVAKGVDTIVVDPAGPVRVTLAGDELAALAGVPAPAEADTALRLAPPVPPLEEHVVVALRAALEPRTDVRAAYVGEGPRNGVRRTLVVVLEPDDAARAEAVAAAVPELAAALAPLVAAEADLRFTVAEPDERLAEIATNVPAAYAR
jgi:hypothetical protein